MLSENTDQNREGCTKCVVWALENENRRNVKSNFEVILPLIFAALTKDRVPGIKKIYMYMGVMEYHISQITIGILFSSTGEASSEYIRRTVFMYALCIHDKTSALTNHPE